MSDMNIHEQIPVALPYWQWVYFLGWIRAHEPREDQMPAQLRAVISEIEASVIP